MAFLLAVYSFRWVWRWRPLSLDPSLNTYFLVCLPVFILLASAGIFQLRSPWVLLGVQVVFLGFGLLEDFAYHLYFHKPQDYRGAVPYPF
jgi:heme A synthase